MVIRKILLKNVQYLYINIVNCELHFENVKKNNNEFKSSTFYN